MHVGVMPYFHISSCPSPPVAVRRDGPRVMRAGELFLPLTNCSNRERGPCILPGQHSSAGPGGGYRGELAPLLFCFEITWGTCRGKGGGEMLCPFYCCHLIQRQYKELRVMRTGELTLPLHWLHHSGEQALHFPWVIQWSWL